MQAAVFLRSPVGKQLVGAFASEAVIPLMRFGVKKGGPVVKKGMKKGASVVKNYGSKACRKVAKRYREPDKSFVVTEQTNIKNGHHIVSVSRVLDDGFLQTMY